MSKPTDLSHMTTILQECHQLPTKAARR